MKENVNVLYLTDNNYAAFAGVSITSLFENNREIENLTVYLIDDEIALENKKKFQELAALYNRTIIFLDLSQGIRKLEEINAPKYRNSYTTYLKLFAFNLLPADVHKIFFIDSDTVVIGKIAPLWTFDMNGTAVAAVRDGLTHEYKMSFGYNYDDSWFNMGIMLVDVDQWREQSCETRIMEQMKKRCAYTSVDQDLLNITLHAQIQTLPPQYNVTPHHFVYPYDSFMRWFKQGGFYSKEQMDNALQQPVVYHFERFIGESPWHRNNVHPYTMLFDQYLELSPWKDYLKKSASTNYILKIEKILYRLLPNGFFLPIFSIAYKRYFKQMNQKTLSGTTNIT